MIPEFNESGYLPAGVHRATIEEIAERFGSETEIRQAQMDSIRWFLDAAIRAGARRILINGSFVTDVREPNDVDCGLLISADFPLDESAADELREGYPFIDLKIANSEDFSFLLNELYVTDRSLVSKGVVEVIL